MQLRCSRVVALARSDTSTMSANNYKTYKTQVIVTYLKGKGLNCCAKKRCEIFKGEKINLLLTQLKTHVIITCLKQFSFFVYLMVSLD